MAGVPPRYRAPPTELSSGESPQALHILEGLLTALDYIDEVISIIRSHYTVQEGKAALMERFGLDDVQAQAIVQMPLGRLAGLGT